MTIDYRRWIAREGAFRALCASFKASTTRDDFIPDVCPCFTLVGLPVLHTSGSEGTRDVRNRTINPLTLTPCYPSVGFAYSITPKD